jgi:hypothetical protein
MVKRSKADDIFNTKNECRWYDKMNCNYGNRFRCSCDNFVLYLNVNVLLKCIIRNKAVDRRFIPVDIVCGVSLML